ncbi:hypothetical protein [Streptosporangium sp. 'caverna']|uniref:hypothetical protein n=1 Tax=Streptosporangium sp. 'caverna' TaxID=2202249 RepID=UPI000D7E67FC|nr:hypothetical protein [Streptosporangium sp. 'caverna']AWS43718.1 hypothetical protein DKM19_22540 [Streptosporangium sp. 'caverna']
MSKIMQKMPGIAPEVASGGSPEIGCRLQHLEEQARRRRGQTLPAAALTGPAGRGRDELIGEAIGFGRIELVSDEPTDRHRLQLIQWQGRVGLPGMLGADLQVCRPDFDVIALVARDGTYDGGRRGR